MNQTMADLEKDFEAQRRTFIYDALRRNNFMMGVTADAIGISRKSLWENCKKLGIDTRRVVTAR